jgi:hypothetical protein
VSSMTIISGLVNAQATSPSPSGWHCEKMTSRVGGGCRSDSNDASGNPIWKCNGVGGGVGLCDKQYGMWDKYK